MEAAAAAYMEHALKYPQLAAAVPHTASIPETLSQTTAMLVLNFPPHGEGSPMGHDPATGACVSPCMRFMLGETFMACSAEFFKARVAVADAVAFEAPSGTSPYKTVSGLKADNEFHRLRAAYIAAVRADIATERGCEVLDVPVFFCGGGAGLVGQQLALMHGGDNLHFADHPEVAVPSALFKGAVLPPDEQLTRAKRNDAVWSMLKHTVHGSCISGLVTAFTRRAQKAPLTAEEYDEYLKGCVSGGMLQSKLTR